MPRKTKIERATEADDLLLRALRQLADEVLEEEVPERLLRPLRDAQRRDKSDGPGRRGGEAAGGRRPGGSGDAPAKRSEPERRRAGSK